MITKVHFNFELLIEVVANLNSASPFQFKCHVIMIQIHLFVSTLAIFFKCASKETTQCSIVKPNAVHASTTASAKLFFVRNFRVSALLVRNYIHDSLLHTRYIPHIYNYAMLDLPQQDLLKILFVDCCV